MLNSSSESHPASVSCGSVLLAAIESMRPYQWLKNALVFVPLLVAHRAGEIEALGATLKAFVAFGLCASSVYLFNDLHDASADRAHPHKRGRPIASGRLPVRMALAAAACVLLLGMALAISIDPLVAGVLALYLALMTAYTLWVRKVVLLDGFVLAGGYALRVIAGGVAIGTLPSPRLLAFCTFLFFSLALVKRYAELTLLELRDGAATHARAYAIGDRVFIVALGLSCGVMSVLVLALYMSTTHLGEHYARTQLIWATCILLLYWVSYVWLAAHRGRMTDDPLVFAVRDGVSLALLILMAATAWFAV